MSIGRPTQAHPGACMGHRPSSLPANNLLAFAGGESYTLRGRSLLQFRLQVTGGLGLNRGKGAVSPFSNANNRYKPNQGGRGHSES